MAKCSKKLSRTVRNQDILGVPIQLSYLGKNSFNTVFGGCISIMLIVLIVASGIGSFCYLLLWPDYYNYPIRQTYKVEMNEIETRQQGSIALSVETDLDDESTATEFRV